MKKTQLRKIIRESIKELMTEQPQLSEGLDPNYPVMRVYRGCNLGSPNNGVGNTSGNPPYSGFIPNQNTGGNYSDPQLQNSPPATLDGMLINNSNIIHNYWGNPSQGQVIKMVTCNPNSQLCKPTCLEYLGSTTSFNNNNFAQTGFGGNSNLTQHLGTYASCEDCDTNNQIIYGCTDSTALNYDPSANTDDGSCKYEWERHDPSDIQAKKIDIDLDREPMDKERSLKKPIDPTINRMQKIANIKNNK